MLLLSIKPFYWITFYVVSFEIYIFINCVFTRDKCLYLCCASLAPVEKEKNHCGCDAMHWRTGKKMNYATIKIWKRIQNKNPLKLNISREEMRLIRLYWHCVLDRARYVELCCLVVAFVVDVPQSKWKCFSFFTHNAVVCYRSSYISFSLGILWISNNNNNNNERKILCGMEFRNCHSHLTVCVI